MRAIIGERQHTVVCTLDQTVPTTRDAEAEYRRVGKFGIFFCPVPHLGFMVLTTAKCKNMATSGITTDDHASVRLNMRGRQLWERDLISLPEWVRLGQCERQKNFSAQYGEPGAL